MASSTLSMSSTMALPPDGTNQIQRFGLGTYLASGDDCYNAVLYALQQGYRHIDTAAVYRNEQHVAQAITASNVPREEIFLTTKLSPRDQGEDSAYQACLESLKRLNTEYVDMYLIHWPGAAGKDPEKHASEIPERRIGSWKALQKLYHEGKAKSIGVSNFMPWHLDHLMKHPEVTVTPSVNQIEFHPLLQQQEAVNKSKEYGILVEAYAPIARAHSGLMENPKAKEIASKYKKTVPQISIRWCLQKDCIVIPKSVHKERIDENANVFDFQLTEEEMETLSSLEDGTRTCWDPTSVTV